MPAACARPPAAVNPLSAATAGLAVRAVAQFGLTEKRTKGAKTNPELDEVQRIGQLRAKGEEPAKLARDEALQRALVNPWFLLRLFRGFSQTLRSELRALRDLRSENLRGGAHRPGRQDAG
jgi:hypothetical protein